MTASTSSDEATAMTARSLPFLKSFVISLLMFVACLPTVAAQEAGVGELRVSVRLNPKLQELVGRAQVTIPAGSSDQAEFFLSPTARISAVTVNGDTTAYAATGGVVSVPLPPGPGDRTVRIQYSCRFADPLPGSFISHEKPSFGVRGVISEAGVFLDKGVGWYPHLLHGAGHLVLEVSAPPGMEAVTEGERILHRSDATNTVSAWSIPSPLYPVALSAGMYRIVERRHGRILVSTYFTSINNDLSDRYLDLAVRYIDFYEELFGPYPFPKFSVVENFLPTGYGYQSYTLIGSGLLRMAPVMDVTLPHEIAHCWWGNSVMADLRQGNWSEGLATYLAEHLIAERRAAGAAKEYRYKLLSDFASLVTSDREFPLRDFTTRSDPVSRCIGYNKGAMVFHMIRQRVGDQAFFDTLRSLATEMRGKSIGWDELVAGFERRSGVPLAASARLWLDKTGGVVVGVRDVALAKSGEGWELSGVLTIDRPDYVSTVKVAISSERGRESHAIAVTGKRSEFRIRSREIPEALHLDPGYDLFRIIDQRELPATVNRIKGSGELTVIIASGRNYDENLKTLIESLGSRDVDYMSEADIGRELPDTDILFYGYPSHRSIREGLPSDIVVRPKEFEVRGTRFNKTEDLLFAVVPSPVDQERVLAICYSLSGYAANSAVTKITHYGSSGLLVFSSGVNRVNDVVGQPDEGIVHRIAPPSAD